MRRPRIYLALILPLLLLGVVVMYLVVRIYAASHDVPLQAVPDLNAMLIALPTLFLWLPVMLLLANFIMRAAPPLRRIAESYVSSADRPDFGTSQRQLAKVLLWFAFVCIPLIVVGWSM
jgi:hypothetical protein